MNSRIKNSFLGYTMRKFDDVSPVPYVDFDYQHAGTRAQIDQDLRAIDVPKSARDAFYRCLANARKQLGLANHSYMLRLAFSRTAIERIEKAHRYITAAGYIEALAQAGWHRPRYDDETRDIVADYLIGPTHMQIEIDVENGVVCRHDIAEQGYVVDRHYETPDDVETPAEIWVNILRDREYERIMFGPESGAPENMPQNDFVM